MRKYGLAAPRGIKFKCMLVIPGEFFDQISAFARLFAKKVFKHATILLMGSLLVVGRHKVCSALRAMGLSQEKQGLPRSSTSTIGCSAK